MSNHHSFDPHCPGCRPAIFDPQTKEELPPDHPLVVTANKIWDSSPREMQEALHRIWVFNSRDPKDLAFIKVFSDRLEQAEAS